MQSVSFLQTLGFSITYLPVDQSGRISVDDFKKEVTDQVRTSRRLPLLLSSIDTVWFWTLVCVDNTRVGNARQ